MFHWGAVTIVFASLCFGDTSRIQHGY
jgi:hypothetical protein